MRRGAFLLYDVASRQEADQVVINLQMYTANTMASAAEAMGMTLPGSSSFPAEEKDKWDECASVGAAMRNLLELDLKPRDIMTRAAFENAMVRSSLPILECLYRHGSSLSWIY